MDIFETVSVRAVCNYQYAQLQCVQIIERLIVRALTVPKTDFIAALIILNRSVNMLFSAPQWYKHCTPWLKTASNT